MDDRLQIWLAEYDHAREVAHHNDIIIYQVAAIVWAANAVLLGTDSRIRPTLDSHLAAIAVSTLGIVLSMFVIVVFRLLKRPQHIAFKVCQQIENEIPHSHRLHQRIDRKYPKGAAGVWFCVITILFVSIWASRLAQSLCFVWGLRGKI
jgi:Ca2+/Na+ antiporter